MKKWKTAVTQTCILKCHGQSQYLQQGIKVLLGNSSVRAMNLKPRLVRTWRAQRVWIVSAIPESISYLVPRVMTWLRRIWCFQNRTSWTTFLSEFAQHLKATVMRKVEGICILHFSAKWNVWHACWQSVHRFRMVVRFVDRLRFQCGYKVRRQKLPWQFLSVRFAQDNSKFVC